jgi:hypothetical protein
MNAKQPRTFKVRGCFIFPAPLPTKQVLWGPQWLEGQEGAKKQATQPGGL